MMKERALRVLLATLMLTASAQAADLTAEVMHPWTSGGEAAAAKVFADQYTAAGGTWVDVAIAGNDAQLAASISSIVGGTPPTATHFNTGKPFEELVAAGLLRDVEDIATAEGWRDVLPKDIVDAISADGKIMAVPVNLQDRELAVVLEGSVREIGRCRGAAELGRLLRGRRQNSRRRLHPHGAWQQFVLGPLHLPEGAGERRQGPSSTSRCCAIATPPRCAIPRWSRLSRRWAGCAAMSMPAARAGCGTMRQISSSPTRPASSSWAIWAKGKFSAAAGMTPGVDYGCSLFPGNEVVVMSGDIFVLPRIDNADQTAAQDLLAHVLFSQETQLQFRHEKGSNPVRNDVDVSSMDVCAQHAAKVQANPATLVPNPQFLMSNDMLGAMADVITKFWNTPSMTPDAFATELEAAFASAV